MLGVGVGGMNRQACMQASSIVVVNSWSQANKCTCCGGGEGTGLLLLG